MQAAQDAIGPIAIERWSDALSESRARIAHRFARSRAGRPARVERKNGWQPAEALGAAEPQGVQRLVIPIPREEHNL
jgi:hypothetical protein